METVVLSTSLLHKQILGFIKISLRVVLNKKCILMNKEEDEK